MIQANELRIGNYVLLKSKNEKDEIAKLLTIDELNGCYYNRATNKSLVNKPYNNQNSWCDFNIINPIPLTEEILLACGFKKGVKGWYKKQTNGRVFNLYMYYMFYKDKHLHQLQNLYFALTNEELQIEL